MLEPVEIPVSEDDAIRFHEAWFSGQTEGVGRVEVSHVLNAPLVCVLVQMEDGRSARYTLDVAEAVRELVARELPEMGGTD